ncbi:MAG TPA: hypothetical protein PLV89_05420 [Treponemataceae bacterium]|nr:hypothetical protein [Treponemataceae bacterium]
MSKKLIWIIGIGLLLCTIISAENQQLEKKLIGIWLLNWDHRVAEFSNNGVLEKQDMFSPGFHPYMDEFQDEVFIMFRENGQGSYFVRNVVKNKDGSYDVVQKETGTYTKKDILSKRIDFTWKIEADNIVIDKVLKPYLGPDVKEYEILWSEKPTRPEVKDDTKIFKLKEEIIIKLIGQFRKITNKDLIQKFTSVYGLE